MRQVVGDARLLQLMEIEVLQNAITRGGSSTVMCFTY
jgi:hypothetical protein